MLLVQNSTRLYSTVLGFNQSNQGYNRRSLGPWSDESGIEDLPRAFWNPVVSAWTQLNRSNTQSATASISLSMVDATAMWDATNSEWAPIQRPAVHPIPSYHTEYSMIYQSSPTTYPSFEWQCPIASSENCPEVVAHLTLNNIPWSPFGGRVLYCRAEKTLEHCTLNFNIHLAYVVVICNFVKVVCMSLTLGRHHQPALITVGDAIESFLNRPDNTTSGLCLHSAASLYWIWQGKGYETTLQWRAVRREQAESSKSRIYVAQWRRWGHSATVLRWLGCLLL